MSPTASSGAESVSQAQKILLVEDNEAAGKGLARLLEARGHEVVSVSDGQSAVRFFEENGPPDVLLTDMQLPDIDGRDLARHARQLHPTLRIVLITGWDLEHGADPLADWGVDRVLSKPVNIQELLDLLNGAGPGPY